MNDAFLVSLADLGQLAVVPLCLIAYFPQWLAIFRSRSSRNVALSSHLLWLLSSSLAVFYAATHAAASRNGLPLLASSLANLLCIIVTIVLVYTFKEANDGRPSLATQQTDTMSQR